MQMTSTQLADQGAQRAAMRADRVHEGWTDRAYDALCEFARDHHEFTTEEVRAAYAGIIPAPPDNRAWGCVTKRAAREGICTRERVAKATAPNVHGGWVTVWKSNVVAAGAIA